MRFLQRLLWKPDFWGVLLLVAVMGAVSAWILSGHSSELRSAVKAAPPATAPKASSTQWPTTIDQGLSVRMTTIIRSYYLLAPGGSCATRSNPADTAASVRLRMSKLVPPQVLGTLDTRVATTTAVDRLRLEQCLIRSAVSINLSKATVTKVASSGSGSSESLYVVVPVFVWLNKTNGEIYNTSDVAIKMAMPTSVYFQWVRLNDSWSLAALSDSRSEL